MTIPNDHETTVKDIKAAEWEHEVANAQIPVLVDFWAPWCGPCRILGPTIDEIARNKKFGLKFVKVNLDDNPSVAKAFNIQSIPTIGIFKGGTLLATIIGAQSKSSLEKFISSTI